MTRANGQNHTGENNHMPLLPLSTDDTCRDYVNHVSSPRNTSSFANTGVEQTTNVDNDVLSKHSLHSFGYDVDSLKSVDREMLVSQETQV